MIVERVEMGRAARIRIGTMMMTAGMEVVSQKTVSPTVNSA